jgi:transcriptional regulator with GAF, ATPase, and Fis domain
MAREDTLVESFVLLADTLVDDYDVIDFLETLAERSVELLDVSAAGIMLADPAGGLRHAACSSERMRVAELFELQLEEGPCVDAYRDRTTIVSDSPEDAAARWPRFAPHALENEFVSVAAVPMRLRTQVIGALNLFSTNSGALAAADLRVAQALADVATIGILHERAVNDARAVTSQLEGALQSRIVIEQAKGIVAEHNHISVDVAFSLIRGYVRRNQLRLRDTAAQIISGTVSPDELTQVPQES